MRGIVLAGGAGTRLHPLTKCMSKQLLPVYDKPMIYYPLSVLMNAGITEIMIITTGRDLGRFKGLLGDGSRFGVRFEYAVQDEPKGIAEAFIIGEKFIGDGDVMLILGDNIFYGGGLQGKLDHARDLACLGYPSVFCHPVKDPRRYGVATINSWSNTVDTIEEKPAEPKSNLAVTGLYIYPNNVIEIAKTIKPSDRGELEITDINKVYIDHQGMGLNAETLGEGFAWMDAGTQPDLMHASTFIEMIEATQGCKVACLEEIALKQGNINLDQLREIASGMNNEYGEYLMNIVGG